MPARSITRADASITSSGSIVSCITPMRKGGAISTIVSRASGLHCLLACRLGRPPSQHLPDHLHRNGGSRVADVDSEQRESGVELFGCDAVLERPANVGPEALFHTALCGERSYDDEAAITQRKAVVDPRPAGRLQGLPRHPLADDRLEQLNRSLLGQAELARVGGPPA